jgi:hypothetical protein
MPNGGRSYCCCHRGVVIDIERLVLGRRRVVAALAGVSATLGRHLHVELDQDPEAACH